MSYKLNMAHYSLLPYILLIYQEQTKTCWRTHFKAEIMTIPNPTVPFLLQIKQPWRSSISFRGWEEWEEWCVTLQWRKYIRQLEKRTIKSFSYTNMRKQPTPSIVEVKGGRPKHTTRKKIKLKNSCMCHMFQITLRFESLVREGQSVTKSKRAQML